MKYRFYYLGLLLLSDSAHWTILLLNYYHWFFVCVFFPVLYVSVYLTVTEPRPSIYSAHILSWNLQWEWLWPSRPKTRSCKTGRLAVSVLIAPVFEVTYSFFFLSHFLFYALWQHNCHRAMSYKEKDKRKVVTDRWLWLFFTVACVSACGFLSFLFFFDVYCNIIFQELTLVTTIVSQPTV